MDLSFLLLERIFGREPQKIVRIFILRMWAGYAFDAGEVAFLWLYVGISYESDTWRYVFYGYCGFQGFMALLLTFLLIQCVIGKDLRRYKIVPYLMAYFKLTSAVNAGFIFFQFWHSGCRDAAAIVLLSITAIDMGFNLIEMGCGFAGFSSESLKKRQVQVDPVSVEMFPRKKY